MPEGLDGKALATLKNTLGDTLETTKRITKLLGEFKALASGHPALIEPMRIIAEQLSKFLEDAMKVNADLFEARTNCTERQMISTLDGAFRAQLLLLQEVMRILPRNEQEV